MESNHKTESDKIVFHSYDELKEYCVNPNNPLDKVILGKEIDSLIDELQKMKEKK